MFESLDTHRRGSNIELHRKSLRPKHIDGRESMRQRVSLVELNTWSSSRLSMHSVAVMLVKAVLPVAAGPCHAKSFV